MTDPAAPVERVIIVHRSAPGMVAGILSVVFGILAVLSLAIVFGPIGLLCAVIGFLQAAGKSVGSLVLSIIGAALNAMGLALSPTFWLIAAGLTVTAGTTPAPVAHQPAARVASTPPTPSADWFSAMAGMNTAVRQHIANLDAYTAEARTSIEELKRDLDAARRMATIARRGEPRSYAEIMNGAGPDSSERVGALVRKWDSRRDALNLQLTNLRTEGKDIPATCDTLMRSLHGSAATEALVPVKDACQRYAGAMQRLRGSVEQFNQLRNDMRSTATSIQ